MNLIHVPRPSDPTTPAAVAISCWSLEVCTLGGGGGASADHEANASADALLWKISWLVAFPWMLTSLVDEVGDDFDDNDDYYCWLHVAWSKGSVDPFRNVSYAPSSSTQARRTAATSGQKREGSYDYVFIGNCRLDCKDLSLGYGEILPSTLWTVVRHWLADIVPYQSIGCVVDLGSGSGNALLATSLAVLWRQLQGRQRSTKMDCEVGVVGCGRPPLKVVGLEIDPDWQPIAHRNCQRVYGDGSHTTSSPSCCDSPTHLVEASFSTSDFTLGTDWTQPADLVLCHATVFSDELMAATASACALCRSGTCFVLVSRPLVHAEIETVRKGQLEMSWGQATVFLQRRR